jgi:tetratricopeptide (TPR) repeat protein
MDEYISISKELGEGNSLKASDYLQLSTSYHFALQYRQAIQALDEAIERYPEKKELYIQRIAAYFEEGRYDEAIRDFILQELDKGHNSWKNLRPDQQANKSIMTHNDPERLLQLKAGTGVPKKGGHPWEYGYKEDVDFGEIIGIWKDETGSHSKPTTIGRIHYDSDGGAHIVPIKPRD